MVAPNETTDGVMGDLFQDVDHGICELQDSLRSNLEVLDGAKPSTGFGWRSVTCDKSSILQEPLEYWSCMRSGTRSECYYLTQRCAQTSRGMSPKNIITDPAEGSKTVYCGPVLEQQPVSWNLLHTLETVHILICHPVVELDYFCNLCSVWILHHAPIEILIHTK